MSPRIATFRGEVEVDLITYLRIKGFSAVMLLGFALEWPGDAGTAALEAARLSIDEALFVGARMR